MIFIILLIFGSAYIFWSWRHYKEKASHRAERLRDIQDLQKLHEEIIQSMEEEREQKMQAGRSSDRVTGAETTDFSGAYPDVIWVSAHGKRYHSLSSCSARGTCQWLFKVLL